MTSAAAAFGLAPGLRPGAGSRSGAAKNSSPLYSAPNRHALLSPTPAARRPGRRGGAPPVAAKKVGLRFVHTVSHHRVQPVMR